MKSALINLNKRIREAALAAGRDPDSIRLVGVSKTKPPEAIAEAVAAGVTVIGESYIQEAQIKYRLLSTLPVAWHFIGHLQTNKVKQAIHLFDLIHSVDSFRLATEIDLQARKIGKIQDILIQVNIADEKSKYGVPVKDTLVLVEKIAALDHVRLKGLMTIPPFFDDPDRARPFFKALRLLREDLLQSTADHISLKELSMGMTGDFETAIAEGATLVRIGTALFGKRI